MIAGWSVHGFAVVPTEAKHGLLAKWLSDENEVSLFADGRVVIFGVAPVELLPFVQAVWHAHQRDKEAY